MLECELCQNWLHCVCVGIPSHSAENYPFVCPMCMKSSMSLILELRAEVKHLRAHILKITKSCKTQIKSTDLSADTPSNVAVPAQRAVGSLSPESCPTTAASGIGLSCTGSDILQPPKSSFDSSETATKTHVCSDTGHQTVENVHETTTPIGKPSPPDISLPFLPPSPHETSIASESPLPLPPFDHPHVKWLWGTQRSVTESEVHKILCKIFQLDGGSVRVGRRYIKIKRKKVWYHAILADKSTFDLISTKTHPNLPKFWRIKEANSPSHKAESSSSKTSLQNINYPSFGFNSHYVPTPFRFAHPSHIPPISGIPLLYHHPLQNQGVTVPQLTRSKEFTPLPPPLPRLQSYPCHSPAQVM